MCPWFSTSLWTALTAIYYNQFKCILTRSLRPNDMACPVLISTLAPRLEECLLYKSLDVTVGCFDVWSDFLSFFESRLNDFIAFDLFSSCLNAFMDTCIVLNNVCWMIVRTKILWTSLRLLNCFTILNAKCMLESIQLK